MKGENYRKLVVLVAMVCSSAGLWAQSERIKIVDRSTTIQLENELPLSFTAIVVDADIEVSCLDQNAVRIVIEEFDWDSDEDGSAYIYYDAESATMRLKLNGDLSESNLSIYAPLNALLKLKTYDGDIYVNGCRGGIDANSSDGSIELLEVEGSVAANTQDGDVTLILNTIDLASPISLATVDGNISVTLMPNINANLEASSIDGTFSSEMAITLKKKSGSPYKIKMGEGFMKINGTINDGGPKISLKTIDGDIEVNAAK